MAYTQRDRLDQVYILASIWIEALFYGVFACLFAAAMYIMTRQRSSTKMSSKIFFGGIILMFAVATLHIVINFYRLIRAYGFVVASDGPISYFHNALAWDNYAHAVMFGIMMCIGDSLVIYRCFIIWGGNYYVIVIPVLLLLIMVAINLMLFVWYGAQFATFKQIMPWIDAGYPLAFVQNVMTTGLIAWKIWTQHKSSQASGLVSSGRLSLINIMRIIVESAMIYTVELLIIIILYFVGHPAQFVVQTAIIPTIGIVFVLIAIRVHVARRRSSRNTVPSSLIAPWLSDDPIFQNDSGTTNPSHGNSASAHEHHSLQVISSGPGRRPVLINQTSETTLRSSAKDMLTE